MPGHGFRKRVEELINLRAVFAYQRGGEPRFSATAQPRICLDFPVELGVERRLIVARVDAEPTEGGDNRVVGKINHGEAQRPQLRQRPAGKYAGEDGPFKRPDVPVRLGQRFQSSLDFLCLVARMLRVTAPGGFDKGRGYADLVVAAASLEHEIQVVRVSEGIGGRRSGAREEFRIRHSGFGGRRAEHLSTLIDTNRSFE